MSLLPIFNGIDKNKSVSYTSTVNPERISAPAATPSPTIPTATSTPSTVQPAVTRRVVARGAYATPSILDALKEEPSSEESGSGYISSSNQKIQNEVEITPFSQDDLLDGWRNFVATIDDAPQLKSALSAREPHLAGNWQIEYELDTELQLNRLTLDLKPKLQGYLRRLFKNEAIEIQFKVSRHDVSQQPNIPYTDAERWNSLVERYPALSTLKSKFGLDFEHF